MPILSGILHKKPAITRGCFCILQRVKLNICSRFGSILTRKINFLLTAVLISIFCLWASSKTHCKVDTSIDTMQIPCQENMFINSRKSSNVHLTVKQSYQYIPSTVNHGGKANKQSHHQTCKAKMFNVSFLKVHKAGSTTVMNIFMRFAIGNDLNIVLPRKSSGYGFNYLGYGKTVSKQGIVPLPNNEAYNILCNHVVYNRTAFRLILPKDTIYVGIVREPVNHFKSAALYYGFFRSLRRNYTGIHEENVMSEFLKDPSKGRVSTYFVHNRMSFDFGIPTQQFKNKTFVDSYIKEISQDYSVMMILEHFSESLVLMKRQLCWSTKDILYIPLNAMKRDQTIELNEDDIKRLKQWNSADVKLYEHFLQEFKAKVKSLGNAFHEEVEDFKRVQSEVERFCKKTVSHGNSKSVLPIPKSKWDDGFIVTDIDCALMMEREEPMLRRLIKSAWARYNTSVTQY